MDKDPEFKALDQRAMNQGVDRFEDVARDRAIHGWEEPIYFKGEQVGVIRKYDHVLLMQRLNAYRPELYRQNVKVDAPDLARTFAAAMEASLKPPQGAQNGAGTEKADAAATDPAVH